MSKTTRCIACTWTSAGAVIVTTAPAAFIGISGLGSANATTVTVFNGKNTAGATIAVIPFGAAAGVFEGPSQPVACSSGIVATNAGTVAGYTILYATL